LSAVPAEVDLSSATELVASEGGYVLAADAARDNPTGRGPHLTIWQISTDGRFTEVFDQASWQVISLASDGPAVVMTGYIYDGGYTELQHPIALVSLDQGATFSLSAGWPDLEAATCIGPVAIHDLVAIAGSACSQTPAPEVLVARLSQP
jgi:hypothetical protein